jgi:hypothetical protein
MSCQKKHTSNCIRKDFFNNNCTEATEKECKSFLPYPPRMTGEEFEKKQADLLQDISEEFRGAISYMAYEHGHSAGYEEVIILVQDLVSNFEEPIQKFEKRIKEESK